MKSKVVENEEGQTRSENAGAFGELTRSDVEESLKAFGWTQGKPHDDPQQDGRNAWFSPNSKQTVIFNDAEEGQGAETVRLASWHELAAVEDRPEDARDGLLRDVDFAQILGLLTGNLTYGRLVKQLAETRAPTLPAHVVAKIPTHTLALERAGGNVFSRAEPLALPHGGPNSSLDEEDE